MRAGVFVIGSRTTSIRLMIFTPPLSVYRILISLRILVFLTKQICQIRKLRAETPDEPLTWFKDFDNDSLISLSVDALVNFRVLSSANLLDNLIVLLRSNSKKALRLTSAKRRNLTLLSVRKKYGKPPDSNPRSPSTSLKTHRMRSTKSCPSIKELTEKGKPRKRRHLPEFDFKVLVVRIFCGHLFADVWVVFWQVHFELKDY